MRKIYFLFLFVLIASMSGLQAAEKWTLVTSEPESWEGDYLIVYEDKAFDGSLTKLDAVNDYTTVTVSGNEITTDACDFYFTIEQIDGGYSIKSASGYYIGWNSGSKNGLNTSTSYSNTYVNTLSISGGNVSVKSNVSKYLQFNKAGDQMRFRYYSETSQEAISLYKKQTAPVTELTAPVITGVVNGETYYGSATVSISYPELATSMTYTITKDDSQYDQKTVTSAVEGLELNEVGSYKVEATATDGNQTLSAEAVEFKIEERPADLGTFAKVTDVATLADGDRIIIVCEEKNVAMAGDQGKYRYPADVTINDNIVVLPFDTEVAVFTLGVTAGGYTFYDGTGYLNSAAEGSSDLPTGEEPFDFTVTISDGNADIVGNTRYIKVNTSAQNRFARYAANFANGADVQIYKEVNTEELVAPTIDGVTNGETYYEEKTITITCLTEGAEILYTVTKDGEELATDIATSPIELKYSESGVYEIEAMSSKDEETSEAVTVSFTIKSISSITSVADFIEIGKSVGDKVVLQLNCPLTVTYKNARSIYAIDAEGSAIQIFNYNNIDEAIGQTYKAGDVIPAGIQGNLELYNDDTPEITNPVASSFQAATETAEVSPIEKSEISLADVNQYVVVRKVTIAEAESANNYILANEAGTEFAAYQNSDMFFNGEVPVGDGKEYDVTGIVSTFKGNVQITITGIELSVEAGVEGVEAADAAIRANADGVVVVAADAVAEVYNAAGQLVATAAVDGESVIAVPAGFYVVRVGNTIAKVVVR